MNIKRTLLLFLLISCFCAPAYLGLYIFPSKLFFVRLFLNFSFFLLPVALLKFDIKKYFWLLSPLVILNAFEFIHLIYYQAPITIGGVAATLETNWHEAGEFISAKGITFVAAFLSILSFFILLYKLPKETKLGPKFRRLILLGFVALFSLQLGMFLYKKHRVGLEGGEIARFIKNRVIGYYPLNTAYAMGEYFLEKYKIQKSQKKRLKYKFNVGRVGNWKDINETYVVIVGETSRRHNWSLYSYDRETNPLLSEQSGLVKFSDAISTATQTTTSITAALTLAEPDDYKGFLEKPSIITAAREAGFKTYWISNQGRYGLIETDTTIVADEAEETHFKQDSYRYTFHDAHLLKQFNKVLERDEKKKLIFIHTIGSHAEYKYRYPEKFSLFKSGGSTKEKLWDEYDNSIVYTDYFVKSVIDQTKAKNEHSWVMFFSDHGENLLDDERKYLGHGLPSPSKHEVEVPLVFWASEEFSSKNKEKMHALEVNKTKPVILSHLFHSLADAMNLSFKDRLGQKSFFSSSYQSPQKRKVLTSRGEILMYRDLR